MAMYKPQMYRIFKNFGISDNIMKKIDDHENESIKDEIGNTTTTMCYHRGQTQSNRNYLH